MKSDCEEGNGYFMSNLLYEISTNIMYLEIPNQIRNELREIYVGDEMVKIRKNVNE